MSKKLNTAQKKIIAEIISVGKIEPACKNAGIAKSTYYQWLKIPEFEAELIKQQDKYYEDSLYRMKRLFAAAIETQEDLLKSENESIRLRASNSIIGKNGGIIESYEHRKRLDTLERKLFEKEEHKKMEGHTDELDTKIK